MVPLINKRDNFKTSYIRKFQELLRDLINNGCVCDLGCNYSNKVLKFLGGKCNATPDRILVLKEVQKYGS